MCSTQALQRTGETGFGVEQELTRDDHAFTTGQACHDLRAPLHATSHTHPHWPEAPVRILHDDPAVPPGGDQRLRGNDWQGLLGVGLHQNLGEHARHQPTLRVAQHNSRPLRATSHVDLGKQRLDLSGKALCRPGTDRGLH